MRRTKVQLEAALADERERSRLKDARIRHLEAANSALLRALRELVADADLAVGERALASVRTLIKEEGAC